jgi:hypothetical protein
LGPGVAGIGTASFLADVGHEIPTPLLPNLLIAILGAPAAALGLIEGVSDGLAGAARLAGGVIAGLLWTAVSPPAAFIHLVAWMLLALLGLLAARSSRGIDP